ncbi:MAG: hypothetical protein HY678_11255, partial [Chloroflexi bacterium]|nr:hypothetical protein [Chloroflexota bacterium]
MGEVQYLEDRVDDAAAGAAVEFRAVAERYVRMLIASHGEYRGPVHMSTDAAD